MKSTSLPYTAQKSFPLSRRSSVVEQPIRNRLVGSSTLPVGSKKIFPEFSAFFSSLGHIPQPFILPIFVKHFGCSLNLCLPNEWTNTPFFQAQLSWLSHLIFVNVNKVYNS